MATCIDYPCCGHEAGCCPDYDESGRQLNMKCVCGATLPIDSRFSICASCMHDENGDFEDDRDCPKYHSQIAGSGIWGCGTSKEEAIGSLVLSNPEVFGINVSNLGKQAR